MLRSGKGFVKLSPWKNWKADHMFTELVNLGKEVRKWNVNNVHGLPLPEFGKKEMSSGKN